LQRTLLPVVPEVEGPQIATRYLVGVDGNQVGGDWYDVLPLPDGAVGIAVGDVGHDLRAAAVMGQVRGVVRSYAWDGDQPGSVLDRCDQLVQGLEMAAMATTVYARLDPPDPDGTRTLHYANAGRPTPLLTSRATTRMRAPRSWSARLRRCRPPRTPRPSSTTSSPPVCPIRCVTTSPCSPFG
jgi:serine phosphatase RsbU (regulator of sigma subunit)